MVWAPHGVRGLLVRSRGRVESPGDQWDYLPLDLAWESALPAILRVRADERPSLSALDALLATLLLVTRREELLAMRAYLLPRPCALYAGVFALRSEDTSAPPSTREGRSAVLTLRPGAQAERNRPSADLKADGWRVHRSPFWRPKKKPMVAAARA